MRIGSNYRRAQQEVKGLRYIRYIRVLLRFAKIPSFSYTKARRGSPIPLLDQLSWLLLTKYIRQVNISFVAHQVDHLQTSIPVRNGKICMDTLISQVSVLAIGSTNAHLSARQPIITTGVHSLSTR